MKSVIVGLFGLFVAVAACATPTPYGSELDSDESEVVSKKEKGASEPEAERTSPVTAAPARAISLTTVSPSSIVAGSPIPSGGLRVTLSGTGLSNANVFVDGQPAVSGDRANETEHSVLLPAEILTQPRTLKLFVAGPDGKQSNTVDFTIADAAAPTLTGITPLSAAAGRGSMTLRVNGSGFDSSSAILFNGTKLSTTSADSRSLSATVPSSLLQSPGQVNVVVERAGVMSAPIIFTLTGGGFGDEVDCGGALTCADLNLNPDSCVIFQGRVVQCDAFDGCVYQGCL